MIDDKELINPVKYFMILAGMWVFPRKKSSIPLNIFYYWYSLILQGIFVIFIVLLFGKLFQLISIQSDVQVIWSVISIIEISVGIFSKIIIYQWNKVPNMFDTVIQKEKEILLYEDDNIKNIHQQSIQICQRISYGLFLNVFFAMVSIFIAGFINWPNENNAKSKSVKEQLETSFVYPIWLPFFENDHKLFTALLNIIFATIGIIFYSVSHMIFIVLLFFVILQFKSITIKIGKLKENPISTTEFRTELRNLIYSHISLLAFVEDLNGSIRYVVFMDFLLNSLNVASVAIQLISLKISSDIIFLLAYLIALVLQVFIFGWLADEIKVQSLAIADSFYFSEWYDLDPNSKKLIHIVMIRAQKSSNILIGPFGPLTVETALKTMQAAYSYIVIMQRLSE
ncbi:odorant receptor 49b-like [Anthonomus grandis grandis]|uniref:odorant receptor 49b-like n=1 Tax=Anthonomus grandis grandis TaxID=2921223 RepID=UPI002165D99C|nr:odorant receptor 49b-like [Anthonomus grandis grandis]